jgi:predicted AAA+ superfamily ATPase
VAALPRRAILDEIQRVPELLRTLKLAVDCDRRPGRLVLTGSANQLLPGLGDALAGAWRSSSCSLQPLTAAEQARAPGRFVAAMLGGRFEPAVAPATRELPLALIKRIG